LTPVVNFTNILRSACAPIFFCQKITKPNYNCNEALSYEKAPHKILVKLTPGDAEDHGTDEGKCKEVAGEIDCRLALDVVHHQALEVLAPRLLNLLILLVFVNKDPDRQNHM